MNTPQVWIKSQIIVSCSRYTCESNWTNLLRFDYYYFIQIIGLHSLIFCLSGNECTIYIHWSFDIFSLGWYFRSLMPCLWDQLVWRVWCTTDCDKDTLCQPIPFMVCNHKMTHGNFGAVFRSFQRINKTWSLTFHFVLFSFNHFVMAYCWLDKLPQMLL